MGPAFGYFANAPKTWLITKKKHLDQTNALFEDIQVNITTHGRPYLGSDLGSKEFIDQFVSDRVNCWVQELLTLSDIAKSQPHAAHAAFIRGFVHKFSFLCRTIPNIECHLHSLENCIRSVYISSLTGRSPPSDLTNPSTGQFRDSKSISASLSNLIKEQRLEYPFECIDAQTTAKRQSTSSVKTMPRNLHL